MQTALERKRFFFFATFHPELFVFIFVHLFILFIYFLLKMCNKFETVYCKIWPQIFNSLQRVPQQSHAQSKRDLHYSKESILSKISSNF